MDYNQIAYFDVMENAEPRFPWISEYISRYYFWKNIADPTEEEI